MHEIDVDGSGTVNYTELDAQCDKALGLLVGNQLHRLSDEDGSEFLCWVTRNKVHCCQHFQEAVSAGTGVWATQ